MIQYRTRMLPGQAAKQFLLVLASLCAISSITRYNQGTSSTTLSRHIRGLATQNTTTKSLSKARTTENIPDISTARRKLAPHVIVTLCNDDFLYAAIELVRLLRTKGAYDGDIVVLYWGQATPMEPALAAYRVIVKDVREILTSEWRTPPPPPCQGIATMDFDVRSIRIARSTAYYYKTAIFSADFFGSKWERVLYLDSRMDIRRPSMMRFFDSIDSHGTIMASPDAWPGNTDMWKLENQFWPDCNPEMFQQLRSRFSLDYPDYFQVGRLDIFRIVCPCNRVRVMHPIESMQASPPRIERIEAPGGCCFI